MEYAVVGELLELAFSIQEVESFTLLIEGEEEIGSPSLGAWARENKDMLACDVMLVSDTTMISEDVPSINTGMRGLAYLEVKVTM